MPLKASLNGKEIHSFEFNSQEWEYLKQTYKSQSLFMSCCGQPGIPKTSKLNNYYFAHKSKSDCLYAKESAEHLYLKFLIAKLASDAGWSVTTEKQGATPAGEQWIADVFCTRNNAKLVFEVQLSPQKDDEFKERQKRYIASGVRALWLRKLRKGSKERVGIYTIATIYLFLVCVRMKMGTCIYHSLGLVSGSLSRVFLPESYYGSQRLGMC